MTVEQANESFHKHIARIVGSVLSHKTVAIYLCNTDLQDIALYNLCQASGLITGYLVEKASCMLSPAGHTWLKAFSTMTVEELDDVDHVRLWSDMMQYLPPLY